MRIASTIGATTVSHDGETYTADDDGVLEVPEQVGQELTAFPAWEPEYEARARADAEQAERDNDVTLLADRVAELERIVAELTADDDAPAKRSRKPATKPAE